MNMAPLHIGSRLLCVPSWNSPKLFWHAEYLTKAQSLTALPLGMGLVVRQTQTFDLPMSTNGEWFTLKISFFDILILSTVQIGVRLLGDGQS